MIQRVMFVLRFRYVFGGAIDVGGGISYVNFLMAGIFVQTVAFGSMTTGLGLAEDFQRGLSTGSARCPWRARRPDRSHVADLVRNMFVVAVMLAVGPLVGGFRPEGGLVGWAVAIGLLLVFSFAFSWIAATVGLLVFNLEAGQSAGFIWLFPLTFASSAFVPPSSMPGCAPSSTTSRSRRSSMRCGASSSANPWAQAAGRLSPGARAYLWSSCRSWSRFTSIRRRVDASGTTVPDGAYIAWASPEHSC